MHTREVSKAEDLPDARMEPLLDCWHRLSRESRLPTYGDFDVLDLPADLWPSLIVSELDVEKDDFFFRVAGSEIDASNGFTTKGYYLTEMDIDHDRNLHREFVEVLNGGKPRASWGNVVKGDLNFKNVSRLCCPFTSSAGDAKLIIGVVFFHHSEAILRMTRRSNPDG